MARTFPVSTSLAGYPKRNGRHDLIAGVTVAALAIPSAMAYAELAGLSPVVGLYALLLPAVAYAFLGSSRQLVVGPEGALSLLVAVSVAPLAAGNPSTYAALAAMLGLLVGAIAVVGRIIRLGWVADYFSRSVLVGYLHGVAVVLVCGQLGKLFGVPIAAEDPLPQLKEFFTELDQIHGLTLLVGAVSIGVLLLLKWKVPKVPAALLVVAAGIAASAAFDLTAHGVATVGHIPAGLPSFHWPSVGVGKTLDLVPAAAGVFAVGFADAILTTRSFAGRNGQHVDANQELLAFGSANVAAGLTQGFPVGASGSRTAVNEQVGGRTQVVGLVAAAVAALVLLLDPAGLGAAQGLSRSCHRRGRHRAVRPRRVACPGSGGPLAGGDRGRDDGRCRALRGARGSHCRRLALGRRCRDALVQTSRRRLGLRAAPRSLG